MKNFLVVFLALSTLLFISFNILFRANLRIRNSFGLTLSGCSCTNYSGLIESEETIAFYERISIPYLAFQDPKTDVLSVASEERWIEVDLSEQKLIAWEGDKPFLESLVSTGLPWWPTPTGEFHIWVKLRATRMQGGSGRYYYNLPNVPYVMYFQNKEIPRWRGYGLHGAYWHNDFGTRRSHGCVNLPVNVAKQLYFWTSPVVPEDKSVVYADDEALGTRIVIHE